MAVESTPERSFSLLFRSSRAADAMTGCGPMSPRCGRRHHRTQGGFDRALWIGQEVGDPGQRLVRLGIEDVEDGADEERMAGLFPMIAPFERSFRIDQDVGDILDVADLPFAATDFQQGIVGRRLAVGRIEQQHPAISGAEARGERPVLALDVVDDATARPGQQRRDDETHALAGTCRRKAKHVLRTIVTKIAALEAAEHHTVRSQKACRVDLAAHGPPGGAIGRRGLRLSSSPHRHAEGHDDRHDAAGRSDAGAFDEDRRRIGVDRRTTTRRRREEHRQACPAPSSNHGGPSCG